MKRTIIIPNVNEGKSFEVPERKPKHRIAFYKKMMELKKETPELMADKEYRSTIEGAYLALFIIQDKYPEATIDNILDMPDDYSENSIVKLSCIAYGSDFDELKKRMKVGKEDFRQPKANKNK